MPEPKPPEAKELAALDRVRHEKFGNGVVTQVSGVGNSMMVTIDFESVGVKRFAAAYAPLTKIEGAQNTCGTK